MHRILFSFFDDRRRLPGSLTLILRFMMPLRIFLVQRCNCGVAIQPLPRTVCQGYRSFPFEPGHLQLSCSRTLPTFLQACHDVLQPSVKNHLTSTRGAPLQILLDSLPHSKVGREVPPHPKLLILKVSTLALFPGNFHQSLSGASLSKEKESKERLVLLREPKYHVPSSFKLESCIEPTRGRIRRFASSTM